MSNASPFRNLRSVNDVLRSPPVQALAATYAHEQLVCAIRDELEALRERLGRGESPDGAVGAEVLAARVAQRMGRVFQPKLRAIINATGIILHTNLGPAPVAEAAAPAAHEAATGHLQPEPDLET